MIHFDVQLIGGIAIHQGKIAEMATGEGKTLVSTLPLYLNSLTGRNAQLVTVNDYLARRDSEWMGHLYTFLGVTVGCIQQQMSPDHRREMYASDITYGTASEFGFDYLRDTGMATRKEDQVQRDYWYCIVDEVDSILVDEARTPLIISGPAPIEREQPFTRLKPPVEQLVNDQTRLCNKIVTEAKELLEKPDATNDDRSLATHKMLQVKMGHPKNKQLLRLMEHGPWRKLLDKTETELNSDLNKDELYKIKGENSFVIDERQHQADLHGNRPGPARQSRRVHAADLATGFPIWTRITAFTRSSARRRNSRTRATPRCLKSTPSRTAARLFAKRDVEYVVTPDAKVMIVDENAAA